jgi:hypothetical protein
MPNDYGVWSYSEDAFVTGLSNVHDATDNEAALMSSVDWPPDDLNVVPCCPNHRSRPAPGWVGGCESCKET